MAEAKTGQTGDQGKSPAKATETAAKEAAVAVKTSTADAKTPESAAKLEMSTTGPKAITLQGQDVTNADQLEKINRDFKEKAVLRQSHEYNIPYINIGKTPLNPDYLKLVDLETARKARLVPFFRVGKKVRVAVEKIDDTETLKVINSLKDQGYEVSINLASDDGITEALGLYDREERYKKIQITENVEEKSIQTYEKEIKALSDLSAKVESVPAEEALNMLNIGAMKTGASDVHYEPEEGTVIVRLRIDGMLHKAFEIKPAVFDNISRQIKYKSKLSLNLTDMPQDGRYDFIFNDRKIDVRVSTIPTPFGESFVCRFLSSSGKYISFEELGFSGTALIKLQNACKISHGMILTTGPTGSGKTTTLYSVLSAMNAPERKLITLEDPVEYHVTGITQSQINESHGYNFASGLRSILRQDPNVVMIGEIRDLETAETAAQAALTGHVLLSTLHTNSAIESIPRLVNMGLPPFMIAPSLHTIIGQRLVRKVCPKCVTMEDISKSEADEFASVFGVLKKIHPEMTLDIPTKIPKTHGCDFCSQTGYSGRVVVAEVFSVTEEIKQLILNSAGTVQLIEAARKEGLITMREDGLMKVAAGITTMEEVHRTTNVEM